MKIEDLVNRYFKLADSDDKKGMSNAIGVSDDLLVDIEANLNVNLPADYRSFLKLSNGFSGFIGDTHIQLLRAEQVVQYTKMYGGDFFPWIIMIGTDGGNEMYVLDKRNDPVTFGILSFIGDDSDFIPLGSTFEDFIRHVYNNDFW